MKSFFMNDIEISTMGDTFSAFEEGLLSLEGITQDAGSTERHFRIVLLEGNNSATLSLREKEYLSTSTAQLNWALCIGTPVDELATYSQCCHEEYSDDILTFVIDIIHLLTADRAIIQCDLDDLGALSKGKEWDFWRGVWDDDTETFSTALQKLWNRSGKIDGYFLFVKGSPEIALNDISRVHERVVEVIGEETECNILFAVTLDEQVQGMEVQVMVFEGG